MGIARNNRIVKITGDILDELAPELDQMIREAIKEHVAKTGWDGPILQLHYVYLTEKVRSAVLGMAVGLINVFEDYDKSPQDAPAEEGLS